MAKKKAAGESRPKGQSKSGVKPKGFDWDQMIAEHLEAEGLDPEVLKSMPVPGQTVAAEAPGVQGHAVGANFDWGGLLGKVKDTAGLLRNFLNMLHEQGLIGADTK
jgi:hypothetical protein